MTIIGSVSQGIIVIATLFMLIIHFWYIPRIKKKQQREDREWSRSIQLQTAMILSLRGEEELSKKVRGLESIEDIADVVKEAERINREDNERKI